MGLIPEPTKDRKEKDSLEALILGVNNERELLFIYLTKSEQIQANYQTKFVFLGMVKQILDRPVKPGKYFKRREAPVDPSVHQMD